MQLSDVQRKFKTHMFDTVEAVENPENDFADLFDVGGIPLDRRLKIYRNHIITTLSEVIAMNFPLIALLTGEDFLQTAAKLYLFDHPPQEACLDRYGGDFPAFLKTYEHANSMPYLADMAQLDWLMNECRNEKNDKTMRIQDLASIAPESYEDTIFHLKNEIRLIHSAFPLDAIYNFCKERADGDETLNIDDGESHILIARVDWDPTIFRLSPSEYDFFILLQQKKTLGECLECVLDKDPEFNFAEFLQNYIGLETFSGFETK